MTKKTTRGRPTDASKQEAQKQRLLDAAMQLLESQSYRSLTIRDIAESAGMKSAMISYYFGSKEGLFLALMERKATVDLAKVQDIKLSDNPLQTFIHFAVAHFSENPGLSRFIADEILTENSQLGKKFIEIMPKRIAIILPALIEQQQKAGKIRADKNAKWLAFSLMNMIVMPFVGASVREHGWGMSAEEVSSPAWAQHIYDMFINGCKQIETPANKK